MKTIKSLIPLVLVASIAAINPAHAEDGRFVGYGDLDLTSPAGQSALDRRIENAVRQVCGRAWPTDLQSQRQVQR